MNTLDLQHILACLPDDMPVVEVSAPAQCSPCPRLLVDGEVVAVRVCDIMVWARAASTSGSSATRRAAPRTPEAFAAIVANVARRARWPSTVDTAADAGLPSAT